MVSSYLILFCIIDIVSENDIVAPNGQMHNSTYYFRAHDNLLHDTAISGLSRSKAFLKSVAVSSSR